MKTAISVPDDLFRAAEQTAQWLGLSRSELYRRALRAYLREHSDQLVTEALNEVYGEPDGATGVDSLLLRLQISSLPPTGEW